MMTQNGYWIFSMFIMVITTLISAAMFWRSRPDKVKAAVELAVKPLADRMTRVEENQTTQAERIEKLDAEDRRQGKELDGRLDDQLRMLTRIEAEVRNGPNRDDTNELHARITEVATAVSAVAAVQKTQGNSMDRVLQFLMEGGGRGKT